MEARSQNGLLREKIPLANGLIAEIWDHTRNIAEGTVRVSLVVKITVPLEASQFDTPEAFAMTCGIFGPEVVYAYENERSFINKELREQTFTELNAQFKRVVLPYLSRPSFPSRFACFHHTEILKHPYRYATPRENQEER
jgi:hypothetical protein